MQNEQLDKQVRKLKADVEALTKLRRPMELSIARLKADLETKDEEVKLVSFRLIHVYCPPSVLVHADSHGRPP